jgi:hypothetical protein
VLVCYCALGRLGGCIPCLVRLCCCDVVYWLQTIPVIVEAGTMFRHLKRRIHEYVRLENRLKYLPQLAKLFSLPPYTGYKQFAKVVSSFLINNKSCKYLMRLLNLEKYLQASGKSKKTSRDGLGHRNLNIHLHLVKNL